MVNKLKLFCLTLGQLIKQALSFPQTAATALKHRRRQAVLDAYEVDRLDRLRHPSKYQGK
jgi:hypothetical protein